MLVHFMLHEPNYTHLLERVSQFDLGSALCLCYILITWAFVVRTYEEGRTSKEGSPAWSTIGLLLCMVWPVLLAVIGFEVFRRKDPW